MAADNAILSALLLLLVTLLIFHSTTTFAAKDDPRREAKPAGCAPKPQGEAYKVVNEFCVQRRTKGDREFCTQALKSDPRSAAAKDLISLLNISVDLAVEKANRTQQFLTTYKATNRALMAVLKDCSAAYDLCLIQLDIIPRELSVDPLTASYDALMASDALDSCDESLKKNKIANASILTRHKTAAAYVLLCVDISRSI